MKQKIIIYWSRRDFRLRDNRALLYAVKASKETGVPFLPLFCIEPYMTNSDPLFQFGYPSRYFLSRALPLFVEHFKNFLIAHEKPVYLFTKLAKIYDLTIYVNEDIHSDFYIQIRKLRNRNITIKLYRDQMTVSKDTVTGAGDRYSVFTPFKKSVWLSFITEKEDAVVSCDGLTFADIDGLPVKKVESDSEKILHLFSSNEALFIDGNVVPLSTVGLPKRILSEWYYSEHEAQVHFKSFLKKIESYKNDRDMLDNEEGTSKMSLALTWGLVSARTLVTMIKKHFDDLFENQYSEQTSQQGPMHYISELLWREFYKYLFFHNPELLTKPFQKKFEHITWAPQSLAHTRFQSWIQGRTGYPIVDAAMMQLAQTGWMHNRARMVAASILTKNLGVDWRWGQEYFRAMLIDLDEASNNGGWQWGASVGADPKPIRIFNPYLQAQNYDPHQTYQKKWLSKDYLREPPEPIVPHEEARAQALKRYGFSI